jgi:hypothetical protein
MVVGEADADEFRAALKPGNTLDLPLVGFSSERDIARRFAGTKSDIARYKNDGPLPVMFELAAGSQAFNINERRYTKLESEKEWVTGGRFRVVSVGKSTDESAITVVTIRQEDVFDPDPAEKVLKPGDYRPFKFDRYFD